MIHEERIVSGQPEPEELPVEQNLRPRRLKHYIGQELVKKNLEVFILNAPLQFHVRRCWNIHANTSGQHERSSFAQSLLEDQLETYMPELSKLDTEKTVIRNSRWRCDHGWDIDLDDGSSHYEIHNNLCLQGGIKLREGFNRHVYNNITVNNTLHPHVWYDFCGDRIHHNIWMRAYRPARMRGGGEVDRNFFTSEADRTAFNNYQWDLESASGDPQFLDPATGDYRVADGSPALEAGFVNFPMDQFGVRKSALKAIARTPDLPHYVPVAKPRKAAKAKRPAGQPAAAQQGNWLGATVAALQGEEFSAFGVSSEEGGIHLAEVPAGSAAAQAGFKADDVVQKVGGKPVKTVNALLEATGADPARELVIDLVREQVARSLTIRR